MSEDNTSVGETVVDPWDSGELGQSEDHVRVASDTEMAVVEDALGRTASLSPADKENARAFVRNVLEDCKAGQTSWEAACKGLARALLACTEGNLTEARQYFRQGRKLVR